MKTPVCALNFSIFIIGMNISHLFDKADDLRPFSAELLRRAVIKNIILQ